MTNYNCGHLIGSLVHRAQGYKRLRDEVIMSSVYLMPEKTSLRHTPQYYLTNRNLIVWNHRTLREETLKLGSFVMVDELDDQYARVKIVNLEKLSKNPDETVFSCLLDGLTPIEEDILDLLAAVPSPAEKSRIACNPDLCKELCSIECGTLVRVLPTFVIGIVTFKGQKARLGPGIYFDVEILESGNDQPSLANSSSRICSADELRVDSSNYKDQSKLNPSNCSKKPNRKELPARNELEVYSNGMHTKRAETKKISDKLNDGSKQGKNSALFSGNSVIWLSETGEQQKCRICFCFPVDTTARVHLGEYNCKVGECQHSKTRPIPVSQLVSEEEYRKSYNKTPQMKNKSYSSSLNEVKVDDLFGIDQLDNCAAHKKSHGDMTKEIMYKR